MLRRLVCIIVATKVRGVEEVSDLDSGSLNGRGGGKEGRLTLRFDQSLNESYLFFLFLLEVRLRRLRVQLCVRCRSHHFARIEVCFVSTTFHH